MRAARRHRPAPPRQRRAPVRGPRERDGRARVLAQIEERARQRNASDGSPVLVMRACARGSARRRLRCVGLVAFLSPINCSAQNLRSAAGRAV